MTIQIIYNEYPLNYDSQTGSFTVGNTVYGATSGASATIRRIGRTGGTTGTLYLESISGTFQNNEIIYEATYEDEELSNTGFETAGGGDPDFFANWTENVGDGAIADEGSIVQAGSHAAKLTAGAGAGTRVSQSFTSDGGYYKIPFYNRGDGTYQGVYSITGSVSGNIVDQTGTGVTGTDYTEVPNIVYTGAETITLNLYCPATNGGIAYYDTVSAKRITNAALANGTVQNPITIDMNLDREGTPKNFKQESSRDYSYSGKIQVINQYGIQEMSFNAMFSMSTYYDLIAWWSWARQGKLWAFTMDSNKTGNTTLDGGAAAGQTTIPLTSTTGFSANDICLLKRADLDDAWEVVTIDSVSDGVSVTASANLKFNYNSGDVFRHLDYWPEVVSLDNSFSPQRTGIVDISGKYWRNTFKFAEAL